ncbi:hypothetical protein BC937DRAFT_95139, partial [Endogone sp. FLAS-F59071]
GLVLTRAFANAVADPNSPITKVYALVQTSSLTNPDKAAAVQAIRDIPNVEIRAAKYDDPKSLTEALQGVDIVVSALSWQGLPAQFPLIEAAKNAGKIQAHDALYASGLNYTIVNTGGFYQHWVTRLGNLGMGEVGPVVIVYGEGKQPANFVDIADVASYVARAVVDPRLENKKLWTDNKVATQLEIIEIWEKVTGRQVQKKFVSKEEAGKEEEKAEGMEKFMWRVSIDF